MSRTTIVPEGAFDSTVRTLVNGMFSELYGGIVLSLGSLIYLNPLSGDDSKDGTSPDTAVKTLSSAYNLATAGQNDVVVLLGDGGTTATARLSAGFTWAKNATHFIGVSSGVNISNRSRIAPTAAVTAFANFFTVSASGCLFNNLQFFQGFDTGVAAEICLTISGSRNKFVGCHIAGMGDQVGADSATSRSVKITGAENQFVDCTIGLDTVTRGAANASVEFASATARNQFIDCIFPFMCDAASPLGILGTGAGCMDRFQLFRNCLFINATGSTSTTMTVLGSLTNASPGGILVYDRCVLVAIGEYGDTLGLTHSYIDGLTGAAATSGIAVKPS